ncbi:MAG: hypothetical protein OEY97_12145 [Nitrospirota bacterium]|nr:hypothetical protein [Nitrospirota bacterium]
MNHTLFRHRVGYSAGITLLLQPTAGVGSAVDLNTTTNSDYLLDFHGDGLEDNCMYVSDPNQFDINGNGIGDACDTLAQLARPEDLQ